MKINYTIPTKWNELSFWQLKMIGRILYSDSEIEKRFLQEIIVFILLIKKPSLWLALKAIFLFSRIPASQLREYGDFILSDNDRLTKFPTKIKVGRFYNRKTLSGPGIRLSNISIGELSYADAFYYNWITEGKTADLQRLTACLYRPIAPEPNPEDIREPFNRLLLPQNAELTDKIPLHVQYIIALAYQGSRFTFMDKFKNVFPKSKVSEEDPKPKNKKAYQPFSKIINAMAMDETQVFGTLPQTEKANAIKFLEIYEETIIQSNKRK